MRRTRKGILRPVRDGDFSSPHVMVFSLAIVSDV